MDPGILVPLIVFSFIFLTIRMILAHNREKAARKLEAQARTSEGGSLRTSELKALVREAVEEANAPLVDRIEAIEHRLEAQEHSRLLPVESEWLEELEVEEPVRVK